MEYYYLKKDEVIKKGDEVDACGDAWRDDPVWVPAVHTVGQRAPDPQYVSHRQYRRPIKRNADSSANSAMMPCRYHVKGAVCSRPINCGDIPCQLPPIAQHHS